MSEYQYYEFRTINRQLTATERRAVDNLSSHGHTTATSFSVDYSWGDFKHRPNDVLERYFDIFFYMANWGTVTLKFRYPRALVDTRAWEPYCIEQESMIIDYTTVNDSVILTFELHHEEGWGWLEPEGELDGVMGLYQEILQGDLRVFYLAWLCAIQNGTGYSYEFDEDMLEPPVPPGMEQLSPTLNDFVELFEVNSDLIAAAAKDSESQQSTAQVDERAVLEALPHAECVDFLYRMLQGEAHLELKLKQRLGLLQSTTTYNPTGKRSVGALLAARDDAEDQRQKAADAAKEAQRQAQMQALAARGNNAWQEVEALIEQKNTNAYKEAATLLQQLGELASEQGDTLTFQSRVARIRQRYSRRSALMRELLRAQL